MAIRWPLPWCPAATPPSSRATFSPGSSQNGLPRWVFEPTQDSPAWASSMHIQAPVWNTLPDSHILPPGQLQLMLQTLVSFHSFGEFFGELQVRSDPISKLPYFLNLSSTVIIFLFVWLLHPLPLNCEQNEIKDFVYSALFSAPWTNKQKEEGLPWWLSGKESTCQCRRSLVWEDPLCLEKLSPCTSLIELVI